MKPDLVLIAAVARNGTVGRDGGLPWHLPPDLKHFRQATLGHPVAMGRRTWESLPDRFRPLPGRRNLVLTRQRGWQAPGATALPSLQAAVEEVETHGGQRLFVIGGAAVYAAALPFADELLLTEIGQDFEGDVVFPAFDGNDWVEMSRERHRAEPPSDFDFSFVRYRRLR